MNTILATVIGLGLAAATAGGAYTAWGHWSEECPDRPQAAADGLNASGYATSGQACGTAAIDCDGEPVGPWTSETLGLIRFRLDNVRSEVPVVVCVTDHAGGVYARHATDLPAEQESVIDVEVPVGDYLAHVAVSHGGGSAHTASSADLRDCRSGAHEAPAEI